MFRFPTIAALLASCIAFAIATSPAANAQSVAPAPVAPQPLPSPATIEPPPVPAVSPLATSPAAAPSASPVATGRRLAAFRIEADRIAFYSSRYVVGADGNVRVVLGDGTRVTGDTFFEDLRLNRFVIAGNVRVEAGGKTTDGAAFSEYFDFDRAYFVPLISEPDRWTYTAGDYAHPLLGRQMPGDAFFLPDLSGERVFLYAKRAVIDPNQSVRFTPARINFGLTFVSFPSYFLNFSPNPNFAQNALAGAFADGPLDFAGGRHGLATAHLRYDSVDKVFPAYEQHLVSDNSYVVASVNPLTRPQKQYNLLLYDRISPGLQAQVALQENAFQHAFSQPLSATGYQNLLVTGSLPHSYLQLSSVTTFDSLLAVPQRCNLATRAGCYYGDPSHPFFPQHPNSTTLNWIGFRHQLRDLPVTFQLRSAYGQSVDSVSRETQLGGVPTNNVFYKSVGIDLTTRSFTLVRDPAGRHRDVYLTGSYDKQRTFFSVGPHSTDVARGVVSLTKLISPELTVLATYTNTQTADDYGKLQRAVYPGNPAVYVNPSFPSIRYVVPGGFFGFSTSRSFNQQIVFTPNGLVTFTAGLRENRDFPATVPGALQLAGGGTVNFTNSGATPYEADFDLRYRFNRALVLDISRAYYFNFAGSQRWAPQFSFQIEK